MLDEEFGMVVGICMAFAMVVGELGRRLAAPHRLVYGVYAMGCASGMAYFSQGFMLLLPSMGGAVYIHMALNGQ